MTAKPRLSFGAAALVLAAAAVTYSNIFANQPVLDDLWVIFDNPLIKDLRRLPEILTRPYNAAGQSSVAGVYRPLTTLSYALDYAAHGPRVFGYHLVNLILHALTCLLVLALGRRLAAGRPSADLVALLAALLFAVHPAHVEAVTGMVGRAEELSALLVLLSLYLACTRAEGRWRLPAAVAAAALAVLAKEVGVVTPVLFALVALLLPQAAGFTDLRRRRGRLVALCALLSLGTLLYLALKASGPGQLFIPAEAQRFAGHPASTRAFTMARALAEYWRILIWPRELGLDFYYLHKIPFAASLDGAVALATLEWAALIAVAVALRRRAPLVSLGISWVFAALLPVLNIVPIGALMAERFLYLPAAGFCWAVAAGAGQLLPALRARWTGLAGERGWLALGAATATVLTLCAARTWLRNLDFRDEIALAEVEIGHAPEDPVMHNNLAVEYSARGEHGRAREHLLAALRFAPGYYRAWVNLGIAQHGTGDDAAALQSYAKARELAPQSDAPGFFIGALHLDAGRPGQALAELTEAARLGPLNARTRRYLALALERLGRREDALREARAAASLDPGDEQARALAERLASPPKPY